MLLKVQNFERIVLVYLVCLTESFKLFCNASMLVQPVKSAGRIKWG
jgi:hypothetical protein